MAERKFEYENVRTIYDQMKSIVGVDGQTDSINDILTKANKDMQEKMDVCDEALYGDLAKQLMLDWNNVSSDFPSFISKFENWCNLIAASSGDYRMFEQDVAGFKELTPLGSASAGLQSNYIESSQYANYTQDTIEALKNEFNFTDEKGEKYGCKYIDTGAVDFERKKRQERTAYWQNVWIETGVEVGTSFALSFGLPFVFKGVGAIASKIKGSLNSGLKTAPLKGISGAADDVARITTNATDDISNFADDIGKTAENITNAADDVARITTNAADDVALNAVRAEKVKGLTNIKVTINNKEYNTLFELWDDIENGTIKDFNTVKQALSKAGIANEGSVGHSFLADAKSVIKANTSGSSAVGKISPTWKAFVKDEVAKVAAPSTTSSSANAANAADDIGNFADDIGKTAGNIADDAANAADADVLDDLENIASGFEAEGTRVGNFQQAFEKAKDGVNAGATKIKEGATKVKDGVTAGANKIKDSFKNGITNAPIKEMSGVADDVANASDDLGKVAGNIADDAANAVDADVLDDLENIASGFEAEGTRVGKIEQAFDKAKKGVTTGATKIKDTVTTGATNLKDGATTGATNLKDGATKIKDTVTTGATKIKDTVTTGATKVKDAVKPVTEKVMDKVNNFYPVKRINVLKRFGKVNIMTKGAGTCDYSDLKALKTTAEKLTFINKQLDDVPAHIKRSLLRNIYSNGGLNQEYHRYKDFLEALEALG